MVQAVTLSEAVSRAQQEGRPSFKAVREVARAVWVTGLSQTEEGAWLGSAGGGMVRSTALKALGVGAKLLISFQS